MHRWLIPVVILSLFLATSPASAQRLRADVEVTMTKLPQEDQNKLSGLDRVIEDYINQREWAPNDYNYEVTLEIQIGFEKREPVEFEDRYRAAFVINNQTNYQHSDDRWIFAIEPGAPMYYDEQFDSFRSLIDFYVFVVLGVEFDKVKKFGGQPYYEQARRIAQMARLSSRYYLGWDRREEWVEDMLEPEQDYVRYLNFLYYTGEWLFYTERDRDTAKQYLTYAIKQLEKIRDTDVLTRFYNRNYYNYANALAEYQEWTSLSKLASLDPNEEHADFYERLLDRR